MTDLSVLRGANSKSFSVGTCLNWVFNQTWALTKKHKVKITKNVRQVNFSQKLQNSFQNSS